MLISELKNRDDVMSTIIKELNGIGIKIRNEKHKQTNVRQKIFLSSKKQQKTKILAI